MLRAIARKMLHGFAAAFPAVFVSGTSVTALAALAGEYNTYDIDAALRVGLPAFIAGLIFFPINELRLRSRLAFTLRVAFATFASALVHRAMLFSYLNGDAFELSTLGKLGVELGGLGRVFTHPSLLLPDGLFDVSAALAVGGIGLFTLVGFAAQPLLFSIARSRRQAQFKLSRPYSAELFEATRQSIPVRTRH